MKLLDIMKKYDRCLVRESAKLAKIYNMILKESEELDEETCPECGNDPCTCDETEKENDNDVIPESEFFEACKDGECKDVDECGLIPEEDFIKDSEEVEENDMLRNRSHNGHIDDPRGVIAEDEDEDGKKKTCKGKECDKNEDEDKMMSAKEIMSAKEFFAEAAKETEDDDINEEEEEIMSAEEFFAEADKTEDADSQTDVNEEEGITLGSDWQKIDAHDLLPENEEKKLEESLKSYRRKNHRLFND